MGVILSQRLAIVPRTLSPLTIDEVVSRNMDVHTHVYVHVQSLRESILSMRRNKTDADKYDKRRD